MDVKVGDKVRAVKGTCILNVGEVYEVDHADSELVWVYRGEEYGLGDYPHDYFEPVAVADSNSNLTIREGHYYKTRDGRKVGPAGVANYPVDPYNWSLGEPYLYCDNGICGDGTHPDADIIAEWTDDEPLHTSTAGFTVPLEAPEFANDNDEPDGKLEVCNLDIAYQMVQTGVCTINEVRKILGLPTIASGHHLAAA